jgi:16S rRNA processing protein RimM
VPRKSAKPEKPAEEYIIVGKLGKTHGVHGWLTLYSSTAPPENILEYKPLYWMTPSEWQPINIDEIKPFGKNFLIHVVGIDNPEIAKKYTGKEIAILRQQLPDLKQDEFYWSDLEGLTVINQKNIELGVIDHLMATGANDVMVVTGAKKHLIPFIRNQVVINIDLQAKIMRVNWDEDL